MSDPLKMWGRTKSCYFWGRRAGSKLKDGTFGIKIKKWANGQNNSGHGKSAKTYKSKR
jgi:hypothetical protein